MVTALQLFIYIARNRPGRITVVGSKFSNVSRLGTTKFMRAKVVTVVSGVITVVSTKFSVTVLGRAKVSNGFNSLESSKLLRQHKTDASGCNRFKLVSTVSNNGRGYKVH